MHVAQKQPQQDQSPSSLTIKRYGGDLQGHYERSWEKRTVEVKCRCCNGRWEQGISNVELGLLQRYSAGGTEHKASLVFLLLKKLVIFSAYG